VRLIGQTADGLAQAGLVGVVLFAPERAASPGRIALGFAVLLLPFSLIAPLAGVLLDRWSRVRVLAWANLGRALLLAVTAVAASTSSFELVVFGSALVAIGLNRLVLAALGASLPRTVPLHLLVSANALAPTLGTGVTVAGAAAGFALRGWLDAFGAGSPFLAAAVGYLLAALATRAFAAADLGPDLWSTDGASTRQGALAAAWSDVRSGLTHISGSGPARRALAAMGSNRVLFGCFTVWTVLLIRFHLATTSADEDNALAALGAVALALGLGLVAAAVTAPRLVRRHGPRRAAGVALALAATGAVLPVLTLRLSTVLVSWVLIGAGAQILKITVDTVLQRALPDELRGRVFVAYDIVFNVAFVAGVTLVAFLPADVLAGAGVALAVAVAYAIAAATTWVTPRR
jgi:MFS family permease